MTTMQVTASGFGGAAVRFGLARRVLMMRAALVVSALLPVSALAQTPADLARLSAVPGVVASGEPRSVVVSGGAAWDLARLMSVAPSAGDVARAAPASAGSFAAGDLARLNAAGDGWWRRVPDIAVAARQ